MVAFDRQGCGVSEQTGQGEVDVLRAARGAVVHGEGAQQVAVAGQDRHGPAGGQPGGFGQVAEVGPERVGGDVGDHDGFTPVGGGATGSDAFTGGDAVDGLVVEVGQAGGGAVVQVSAVRVGEQDRDEYAVRGQAFDAARHAVEHFGQGRLPGDLLQQNPMLGQKPLGVSDLGGLDTDHPDADHGAGMVAARFVGEVEVHLPRLSSGAKHHAGVAAGVGLTGAVDLVKQIEEALTGQLRHQLGDRGAEAGPVLTDGRDERRVRDLEDMSRAGQDGEHSDGLPEQCAQVLVCRLPGTGRFLMGGPLVG